MPEPKDQPPEDLLVATAVFLDVQMALHKHWERLTPHLALAVMGQLSGKLVAHITPGPGEQAPEDFFIARFREAFKIYKEYVSTCAEQGECTVDDAIEITRQLWEELNAEDTRH